jgi:hypothetical protein
MLSFIVRLFAVAAYYYVLIPRLKKSKRAQR